MQGCVQDKIEKFKIIGHDRSIIQNFKTRIQTKETIDCSKIKQSIVSVYRLFKNQTVCSF